MSKKNVYFLCYTRYTLMVAYIIKKQYHDTDNCILVIGDELSQLDDLVPVIRKCNLWAEVDVIAEKAKNPESIYETVDEYIKTHKIDIFYTANILRYASHYFVHKLSKETHIYMYDEGIISLDIINEYRDYLYKSPRENLVDFEFSRIEKFYVFFGAITKPFANVEIVQIQIDDLLLKREEAVNELNSLFDYKPEGVERKYVIIDSNIAQQMDVTQEYEDHCAKKIVEALGKQNCTIKIKPNQDLKEIYRKYGAECSLINNGRVPFELMYLNWIEDRVYPKEIIAFPTTLIWNIAKINDILGVHDVRIVSVAKIMSKYYLSSEIAARMLVELEDYLSCLKGKDDIFLPEDWKGFYDCIGKAYKENDDEKEWLICAYKKSAVEERKTVNIWREKTKTLFRILKFPNFRESLVKTLDIDKEKQLYLYGTGDFAEMVCSLLEPDKIAGFVRTHPGDNEVYFGKKVLDCRELKNDEHVIVLNTAVGFDEEVRNILAEKALIHFVTLDDIMCASESTCVHD